MKLIEEDYIEVTLCENCKDYNKENNFCNIRSDNITPKSHCSIFEVKE